MCLMTASDDTHRLPTTGTTEGIKMDICVVRVASLELRPETAGLCAEGSAERQERVDSAPVKEMPVKGTPRARSNQASALSVC